MPRQKRFKTKYIGVTYVIAQRKGKPTQTERLYYIRYKKDGKLIEETAGRQFQNDMTPAKASRIRADRIEGRELPNTEKREAEKAAKEAGTNRWTISKLWDEYRAVRKPGKSLHCDKSRYELYLREPFGDKEPAQIDSLSVERIKRQLLKTKSPQTVKHVLDLMKWIINFGVKRSLCESATYYVEPVKVHNRKIEDLSHEQLVKLLEAIERDDHQQAGPMMKMALFSGLRRGEMFRLKWKHINFEKGFIELVDTKGGHDQVIPLNSATRDLLESIPKTPESPFIFPGRG
ncbi:MAG: tyrosine-type recombinase/integrase, partial [Desulfatiglandales bacterium]